MRACVRACVRVLGGGVLAFLCVYVSVLTFVCVCVCVSGDKKALETQTSGGAVQTLFLSGVGASRSTSFNFIKTQLAALSEDPARIPLSLRSNLTLS